MSDATATTVLSTIPSTPQAAPEAPAAEQAKVDPTAPTDPAPAPAPAQEEPEDKNLELAKRFDAIAKREARAKKSEVEYQQRKAELDAQYEKLKTLEAQLEAALEDPVDYYLRTGKKDPVEVAKRFARPLSPEEKEIQELKKWRQETEEQKQKEREEAERRAADENRQQMMRTFVSSITPDECPNLTALYEPHEVPGLVKQMLNAPSVEDPDMTVLEYFNLLHDRNPTDAEIRKALEHNAEARATRILSGRKQDAASDALTQSPQAAPNATPGGPPSLSNQHAASSSTAPRATKKTREQIRKELTEALEAEAAERNGG